jgi:hypothetical protein
MTFVETRYHDPKGTTKLKANEAMRILLKLATLALLALLSTLNSQLSTAFAQGTAFTYQGRLLGPSGPIGGSYLMTFTLFETNSGGSAVAGPVTDSVTIDTNGLFIAVLDFGPGVFGGSNYWLGIGVKTNIPTAPFSTLSPRQEVTPVPYSIYAGNATMLANGVAIGTAQGNYIAPGSMGAFMGGGSSNQIQSGALDATIVGGGDNLVEYYADHAFIGGGLNNRALSPESVIAGGEGNGIGFDLSGGLSLGATISGGLMNSNSASYATVGGGVENYVEGMYSTVCGGSNNVATDDGATVCGGYFNIASGIGSVVAGGFQNVAAETNVSIASMASPLVAGNNASPLKVIIPPSGSPVFNTVGGGTVNAAYGYYSTVAGGDGNTANAFFATVGGGHFNTAGADDATVAGGDNNLVTGVGGSIPGGIGNSAGQGSFAAGDYAHANSNHSFVWGDGSTADYDHGPNTFNALATNGVYFTTAGGTLTFDGTGNLSTPVLTITGGADVAEPFQMSAAKIPKGSVVIIDEEHPGQLKLSDRPYDQRVAGIVSGANGINPGISLHQVNALEGDENVALSGRVYVLAEAANGAIQPGDLLTTSATPGYAMKVTDHARAQGAILGKAMTGLNAEKGMVLVLVTLQ